MGDEDTESIASSSSCTSIVTSEDGSSEDGSSDSSTVTTNKKRGVQVPPGYQPIPPSSNATASSISALNTQEIDSGDLWVVRLPKGVKPKHLAGLQLDLSSVNTSNLSHGGSKRVGEIKVGDIEYDIFAECIPVIKNKQKSTRLNSLELSPETNEISQLNPLLPNQRKNPQETQVLLAPQRISMSIFFRRRIPNDAGSTKKSLSSILTEKTCVVTSNVKRPQPPGLELRNIPFGANLKTTEHDTGSDEVPTATAATTPNRPTSSKKKSTTSDIKPSHSSKRPKLST
ncbi:hypothetical protein PGT21_024430 [Puccinia graminis f. sp. tritici]|uniref:Uncharacterized protein n=1 Tax=Puccinia graminis f. sp. tritici TaxID=56615 RepID=A0A5B0PUN9_PUCGR|nr:hypothetical protein PGTUg99_024047 [Puccinia graminis f. sp. tritici]KAA1104462.1 hypothetical protein PGT21_024430 [Puccinia graminis f. sp. tritici]